MKQITFHCKTITPMFLAGADGRTPELRPSAIKGALRFWWRAMQSFSTIEELKKEEVKIFGGSYKEDRKEKSFRSSFDFLVSQPNKIKSNPVLWNSFNVEYDRNKRRNKKSANGSSYKGLAYLFYSINLGKNKKNFHIPEGQTFTITLSGNNDDRFKSALCSLWLLTWFGAIGGRARKGAGSFEVENIDDREQILNDLKLDFSCPEITDIEQWLCNQFSIVKKVIRSKGASTSLSYYSTLGKDYVISNSLIHSSWKEALDEIGDHFEEFRANNRKVPFQEVAWFGLPVSHSSGGTVKPVSYDRRAAPFIIRIIHLSTGYAWLILELNGEFLPHNEKVKFRRDEKKADKRLFNDYFSKEILTIGRRVSL